MARTITVEITADTSQLVRALKRAEYQVTRSWWRRMFMRVALWRLDRNTPSRSDTGNSVASKI